MRFAAATALAVTLFMADTAVACSNDESIRATHKEYLDI